jgi:hypothetical protein
VQMHLARAFSSLLTPSLLMPPSLPSLPIPFPPSHTLPSIPPPPSPFPDLIFFAARYRPRQLAATWA